MASRGPDLPAAGARRPDGAVLAAWSLAATLLAALLTVAGGGQPALVLVLVLLFVAWSLQEPLVTLPLIIVTQVIWLFGSFAPGGVSLLAPSKLALLLALAVWIVWAWRQRVLPTWAPHMGALAAFAAVVVMGPVLTPAFEDSITGIGKYAVMFLPYLLVANLAIHRRGVELVVRSLVLTATVAALLALVERFLPGVRLEFDGVGLGAHIDDQSLGTAIKRVTGGIGDANWFSYTMATLLPLTLYLYRSTTHGWMRAAAVAAALLQFAGLVLSYTRTPLLGLAGALLLLLWTRRVAVLPLVAVGVVGLVSAPLWLPAGVVERVLSTKYVAEGSTPVRREIFQMAIELVRDKPLLGHGYQQYGPQFIERSRTEMGWEWDRRDRTGEEPAHLLRAHNLYLDVWVQHGLLGLIPLLLMYAWLLRELWQVAQARASTGPPAGPGGRDVELALALMACLVSFYLCGLGGHSQELKVFWILAGLVAAFRRSVFSADGR